MTLAGTAITRVGLRPRHNELRPSCLAILRSPSRVEVKVLRCVSSTAHSVTEAEDSDATLEEEGVATQNWALLLTQKTSRQHAVTPRLVGRLLKEAGAEALAKATGDILGWDWRRTRTTSNGVTEVKRVSDTSKE